MKERLPFTTFDFPVAEFRRGYYSAVYFWREKRILEQEGMAKKRGLMQIFNKVEGATICGIDEVLALLRLCTGHWRNYEEMYPLFDGYIQLKQKRRNASAREAYHCVVELTIKIAEVQKKLNELWVDTHEELEIKTLYDGNMSPAWHAVMTIDGPAAEFAHLESIYLGILARSTMVATNTRKVVEVAEGKPILFFADRFDRWHNQVADGYAAMKGGALGVATDAMGAWWGAGGIGTMPHALIALYDGKTVDSTLAFARRFPDVKTISLVDFDNDCVATSLAVARAFKEAGLKLEAVRLDTSGNNVDKSVQPKMGHTKPTGVCPQLVENVRVALDNDGHPEVKIFVSGGFNVEKIQLFNRLQLPYDGIGVGSSLLKGNFDHTADVVIPVAKVGREYRPGPGLKSVAWTEIQPM